MQTWLFGFVALLWLMPAAAHAAAGSGSRSSEHWGEMQKLEYHIGQISGVLRICGNYTLAADLQELAKLSPYGRKGMASVQVYDAVKGGYCGKLAAEGERLMADRNQLWTYLTDRYNCSGGKCAPAEGDDSTAAVCRAEVDEHLKTLPIDADDIKTIRMINGNAGSSQVRNGKKGHEAWVRLGSCDGWLIIETSIGCTPRQSFTRGDCAIEGIKGY
ncbi:MAG: hypothetical protein RH942_13305 [Kiloniellaceae bacterium]